MPKTSSILSTVSTEHRLVTDRQTDRQTQTDTGPQLVLTNRSNCLKIFHDKTSKFKAF